MRSARLIVFAAAAVSAIVSTSVTSAADLAARPYTKAAVAAPVFSWTGCYVGGLVGWGYGRNRIDNTDPFFDITSTQGNLDSSGAIFGGQVGCNYQFAGNWVAGIEGSVSAADINGRARNPLSRVNLNDFDNFNTVKTDFLASVTGRLGYTWGQTLVYVKGGGAWSRNRWDISDSVFGTTNDDERIFTRTGWTVGAGAEWAMSPNWSWFAEYNHYDFGNYDLAVPTDGPGVIFNVKQTIEVAKVGVNYRFTNY